MHGNRSICGAPEMPGSASRIVEGPYFWWIVEHRVRLSPKEVFVVIFALNDSKADVQPRRRKETLQSNGVESKIVLLLGRDFQVELVQRHCHGNIARHGSQTSI